MRRLRRCSAGKLARTFDYARQFGNVDAIFNRVLGVIMSKTVLVMCVLICVLLQLALCMGKQDTNPSGGAIFLLSR